MAIIEITCRQCLDAKGSVDRRTVSWVKSFGSYAEINEDIAGVRVLIDGEMPPYMTETFEGLDTGWQIQVLREQPELLGKHVDGTPDDIRPSQATLNRLLSALTAGRANIEQKPNDAQLPPGVNATAADLLRGRGGAPGERVTGEVKPEKPLDLATLCLTPAQWAARAIEPEDRLLGDVYTTTTRSMFSADTGLGKTMMGLGKAFAMRLGEDFLQWKAHRQVRVLYLDGEMHQALIQERLAVAGSWFGCSEPPDDGLYLLSSDDVEDMPPLDTPEGERWLLGLLDQLKPDFAFFDNIGCLTSGSLKEEDGARALAVLQSAITKQRIGQEWLHHTGHDATRAYGPKLREWRLDTSLTGEKLDHPTADVAMLVKFGKARRRKKENRADFESVEVLLEDGKWSHKPANGAAKKPLGKSAQLCLDALEKALAEHGRRPPSCSATSGVVVACTEEQWRGIFNRICPAENKRSDWSRGTRELVAGRRVQMWGASTDDGPKWAWPA